MKPLETAPILLKPRVRLRYRVPLSETLELVRTCRYEDRYYLTIKQSTERVLEGSNRIFANDVFDLSLFEIELETNQYRITPKGRYALGRRLNSTYADGMEFKAASVFMRGVRIEPIVRLRPRFIESEDLALEAATMSRRIGVGLDVEVGV